MKWIITKDLIVGPDGVSRVGHGTYARHLPIAERRKQVASIVLPRALPHEFRLKDDDGIVYYVGRSDDDKSQDAFAPLDWAMADAGCTSIEYKVAGKWEVL